MAEGSSGEMVKFLKPNKAVVILQGRYAGRKAVIVRNFATARTTAPTDTAWWRDRPSLHEEQAKKSRVKCFIKLVNYNHIVPTRYTLDVYLKESVTLDSLQSRDKKVTAAKETKAQFEERFKTGKNRWLFTKLRF
ncbi:60S ribosomal L27-3-like [Olea europaea subsp. europaea]|uniref:60S ribosomal L27-3-like n=1 Tax=Olea europaea subsp. europaea TaxID=158383 RepID=A0A8S0VIY5_OLEEU|nr:60S ribosomal L27-3-like [Olea europaea subsp. europaea]